MRHFTSSLLLVAVLLGCSRAQNGRPSTRPFPQEYITVAETITDPMKATKSDFRASSSNESLADFRGNLMDLESLSSDDPNIQSLINDAQVIHREILARI